MIRRLGQTVAGRPAHDGGIGVNPRDGAELPQACVGLVVHGEGPLPDLLQGVEILDRARAQQALVIEGLNQGQDDLTVDVVLQVLMGLIADPNGLHAAIALDRIDDALADARLQPHAIDRLDMAAGRGVDEVAQIAR